MTCSMALSAWRSLHGSPRSILSKRCTWLRERKVAERGRERKTESVCVEREMGIERDGER